MRRIFFIGVFITANIFLFSAFPDRTFGKPFRYIEGSISFTPPQLSADIEVEVYEKEIKSENLYIARSADTERPFRFRIPIDEEMSLEELYIHIIVRKPEGYSCPYRGLRAHQPARLKKIPIRRVKDLYFLARSDFGSIIASGDIDKAKNQYREIQYWGREANQSLVAALDLADFLSQYKSERDPALNVLVEVEKKVKAASPNIQKRYWRTRRNAVMRLAGFNDFKDFPLHEFAQSVGAAEASRKKKAWTDFTTSIATAIGKNKAFAPLDAWKGISLDTLKNKNPGYEEIKMQLKILEPILGPTIITK